MPRFLLIPLLLLTFVALLLAHPASAGILVEGRYEDTRLRAELGDRPDRVLVTLGSDRRLVDLTTGTVEPLTGPASPAAARAAPTGSSAVPARSSAVTPAVTPVVATASPFTINALGGGTVVAGYYGTYHLVTQRGLICAEILASGWMAEPLKPIIAALALVEQADPRLAPRPRGGCAAIRVADYASRGWPLMAGWKDRVVFLTEQVRFDHTPPPELLR